MSTTMLRISAAQNYEYFWQCNIFRDTAIVATIYGESADESRRLARVCAQALAERWRMGVEG